MTSKTASVTLLLVSALLGAGVAGQTFRAASDLVVLQVAVHDAHAAPVPNLTATEFRVWEDQAPQDIQFFVSEDRPVAIGLVVDNSTSMAAKRHDVIEAAEAFARTGNPGDELFVVNFNERVSFGLPDGVLFTSDLTALHDALATIGARGQTAMYDGVAVALDHLAASPLDQKVLVLVSDGDDNRSRRTFDDVLDRARRSNAVIYVVGIFDPIEGGNRKVLKRLADATGGLTFFPEKASSIRDALDHISTDVRHRYTIGYISSNRQRDGSFRRVKVTAMDSTTRRPLVVRVRDGYVAPER